MASISHGLVLTTAMLVSSTVLYLAFFTQKGSSPFQIPRRNSNSQNPSKQILRSCLCSEEKKKRGKKKKRVKFAENVIVKESKKEKNEKNRVSRNNYKKETEKSSGMSANRIALYNGIMRDRGHRMTCCH